MKINWELKAKKLLVGRKIQSVRYMTVEEAEEWMFTSRPLVLKLDNGLFLIPLSDDEGNDGGALFTTDPEVEVLPVKWVT
ncbi:MAG: hypothetical protein AAGA96_08400 [Verrucomicrobiota bacterium]